MDSARKKGELTRKKGELTRKKGELEESIHSLKPAMGLAFQRFLARARVNKKKL